MKVLLLFYTLLVFSTASSQILVDQAGDDWKSRVDSALLKIQHTDSATWKFVNDYVLHISFWNGEFSTTEIDNHGKWSVVISASDIRLNSVNNIACIIVHESYHIYSAQRNIYKTVCEEELAAYTFEQAFQAKIPNLETWINNSTTYWLELYKDRVKTKDFK
jgi:hypothetical protein